jgi:hypothetical protein
MTTLFVEFQWLVSLKAWSLAVNRLVMANGSRKIIYRKLIKYFIFVLGPG